MKRGEIWSVAAPGAYSRKPRPSLIIQSEDFEDLASVTVCPFTSSDSEAPALRPIVAASLGNGLNALSRLMVDKIATVSKTRLGRRIGELPEEDMLRINRALLVFLGLAG